jgi:hypothetical protein
VTSEPVSDEDPRVITYTTLRRRIGVIGIVLPFVLAVGHAIAVRALVWQESLSDYYHTEMRNWLVGSLCAIGVYLWAYKGYDRTDPSDDRATNAAGLAAVLVAFLPTTPDDPSRSDRVVGVLHISAPPPSSCCWPTPPWRCSRRPRAVRPRRAGGGGYGSTSPERCATWGACSTARRPARTRGTGSTRSRAA